MPERWDVSISRVVLRWPSDMIEKDGRASARVVDHVRFPTASWTRRASRVAVMALVFEPRWNWSVMRTGVGSPCLRTPVTCDSKGPSRLILPTARAGKWFFSLYLSRISRDFFSAETWLFFRQIADEEGEEGSSLILSSYTNSCPNTDGNTYCSNEQKPSPETLRPLAKNCSFRSRFLNLILVLMDRLGFHGWQKNLHISELKFAVMEVYIIDSTLQAIGAWTGRSIEIRTLLGAKDQNATARREEGGGAAKMIKKKKAHPVNVQLVGAWLWGPMVWFVSLIAASATDGCMPVSLMDVVAAWHFLQFSFLSFCFVSFSFLFPLLFFIFHFSSFLFSFSSFLFSWSFF